MVVGDGPMRGVLRDAASPNVTFRTRVTDLELRWLYANCDGVVTASHEDFGLTPLEGLAFGKPTAAMPVGGFLDTIVEGETGVFFDGPTPSGRRGGARAAGDRVGSRHAGRAARSV